MNMVSFCPDECNILYKALRYYQVNKTTTGSREYLKCDDLLLKLNPHKIVNGIEPGFRSDT